MAVGPINNPEDDSTKHLTFRSALVLQQPVLDPCLAVGFLPLPSSGLRVGQLVTMKWRVERLKYFEDYAVSANNVSHQMKPSLFTRLVILDYEVLLLLDDLSLIAYFGKKIPFYHKGVHSSALLI